jgi:hypothetical protein
LCDDGDLFFPGLEGLELVMAKKNLESGDAGLDFFKFGGDSGKGTSVGSFFEEVSNFWGDELFSGVFELAC